MKIIFVRHGKPDYKTDTLIDIGKIQADEVAKRLLAENVTEIYSSTMGRALQTAAPFSDLSGISVQPLEFAREINWGAENGEELLSGGNPWFFIPEMVKAGKSVASPDEYITNQMKRNTILESSLKRVTEGLDAWLSSLGYTREGSYYRVEDSAEDKTVALFCHGGSSTAMISHLLSIPFLHLCAVYRPYFTSVSIIEITADGGCLAIPKIKLLSDDRHTPRDNSTAEIKK